MIPTYDLPAAFVLVGSRHWQNSSLHIGPNWGGEKTYYEDARDDFYGNYTASQSSERSETIIGIGFSIAEAVISLNSMLKRMGISQEYSIDGLPTAHDTHYEYHYLRTWRAVHRCSEEDRSQKQEFVKHSSWPHRTEELVRADMDALYATQLSEPWERSSGLPKVYQAP